MIHLNLLQPKFSAWRMEDNRTMFEILDPSCGHIVVQLSDKERGNAIGALKHPKSNDIAGWINDEPVIVSDHVDADGNHVQITEPCECVKGAEPDEDTLNPRNKDH